MGTLYQVDGSTGLVHFHQGGTEQLVYEKGTSFPVSPAPVDGQTFYRTDTDQLFIFNGSIWIDVSTGGGATTALNNLASVAINTSLLPATTNSIDLGGTSKSWAHAYMGDGTVALPALSFASDPNSGLYNVGADDIAIATNGVKQLEVSTTAVTTFLPTAIKGTTTNDSATAGKVGEYVSSAVTSPTAAPATGAIGDLTSIALTAGDWDVHLQGHWRVNTSVQDVIVGIGTAAGNDGSGLVIGSNQATLAQAFLAAGAQFMSVAPYRVSLSASATIYYKYSADYTGAVPDLRGIISARRIR